MVVGAPLLRHVDFPVTEVLGPAAEGFDRDDPRWQRLGLSDELFASDASEFELEVNQLRTHQGQSDLFVINPHGTILAPTFGGARKRQRGYARPAGGASSGVQG